MAGPNDEEFESHRSFLFGLAYRMTGSREESEDMVQEAWVRWADRGTVAVVNAKAYLAQIVTRLCLDHEKSARVRRERYVGTWLPEPLVDTGALSPESRVELRDDVTFALLLALDRLSILERAAFVLHDVFGLPFRDVSECLDRSEAACRQLAVRARGTLQGLGSEVPRPEIDPAGLVAAFFAAVEEGDLDGLKSQLTPSAVLLSDGGGKVPAALNPIRSSDHIARFLIGAFRKFAAAGSVRVVPTVVNGLPGLLAYKGGKLEQVAALECGADGLVSAIYVVRNPDKLSRVAAPSA